MNKHGDSGKRPIKDRELILSVPMLRRPSRRDVAGQSLCLIRTPIRNAMRQLVAEGLLMLRREGGVMCPG
jgi:hypothetical protein